MFSGILTGLATVAVVTLLSAFINPKTLPGMPRNAKAAFIASAILAMMLGLVLAHHSEYAFGNFLGLLLGCLAVQKLLARKL